MSYTNCLPGAWTPNATKTSTAMFAARDTMQTPEPLSIAAPSET